MKITGIEKSALEINSPPTVIVRLRMSVNSAPYPEAEVHRRDVTDDILPIRQHRPEATVTFGIQRTAVHLAAARRLPETVSVTLICHQTRNIHATAPDSQHVTLHRHR